MSDDPPSQTVGAQLSEVLLVVALGRLGTIVLGFVCTILLVRALSPSDFAAYTVAFGYVSLLSVVSMFSAETTITRDTARAIALGDRDAAKAAATGDIFSTGVFSIVAAAIGIPILDGFALLPQLNGDNLVMCVIWVAAMSLNRVTGEWLRGLRYNGAATLFSGLGAFGGLFNSAFIVVALLFLLATHQFSLTAVIAFSAASYLVSALVGLAIGYTRVGFAPLGAGVAHWLNNAKSSSYIYATQLLNFFSSQQGYVIASSMLLDPHGVAVLAIALRIYSMANTVLVTINQASSELIVRLHAVRDNAGLERVIRLASSAAVAMAGAFLFALALLQPAGFRLIFGGEYGDAYGVSLIFIAAAVVSGFGWLASRALALLGYARSALLAQICAALATALIVIPLGWALGVYGFAVGCLVASIIERSVAGRLALRNIGVRCHAYLDLREYAGVFSWIRSRVGRRT